MSELPIQNENSVANTPTSCSEAQKNVRRVPPASPSPSRSRATSTRGSMASDLDRVAANNHAKLKKFESSYEDLVDLLCSAAQSHLPTSRENQYADLRKRLRTSYADIRRMIGVPSPLQFRSMNCSADPFLSLTASKQLEGALFSNESIADMIACQQWFDVCRRKIEMNSSSRFEPQS